MCQTLGTSLFCNLVALFVWVFGGVACLRFELWCVSHGWAVQTVSAFGGVVCFRARRRCWFVSWAALFVSEFWRVACLRIKRCWLSHGLLALAVLESIGVASFTIGLRSRLSIWLRRLSYVRSASFASGSGGGVCSKMQHF